VGKPPSINSEEAKAFYDELMKAKGIVPLLPCEI
jgi:hypothetical protein